MWSDDYEGNGNAGGNSDGYEGGWEGNSAAYETQARQHWRDLPADVRAACGEMPRKWVSDRLREMAEPDEFGRTSPFAVYVYYRETGREIVRRNLSLADAEAMADSEAAEGRRVHVSLDTCG